MVYQACEGSGSHDAGIRAPHLKPETSSSRSDGAPFVNPRFGTRSSTPIAPDLGITTEGLVMGTPYNVSSRCAG